MDAYELGQEIGRGGEGAVYRVTKKSDRAKQLVLKQKFSADLAEANANLQEAMLMAKISHPNVVQLEDVFLSQEKDELGDLFFHVNLVQEFCSFGDLFSLLLKCSVPEPEQISSETTRVVESVNNLYQTEVLTTVKTTVASTNRLTVSNRRRQLWITDLVNGLHAIHQCQLVHRDLKLENVFIDQHRRLKIGDMGLGRAGKSFDADEQYEGTYVYFPPEVVDRQPYDARADVFSLGLVLSEVIASRPWVVLENRSLGEEMLRQQQQEQQQTRHAELVARCTAGQPEFEPLADVLLGMLEPDAGARLPIDVVQTQLASILGGGGSSVRRQSSVTADNGTEDSELSEVARRMSTTSAATGSSSAGSLSLKSASSQRFGSNRQLVPLTPAHFADAHELLVQMQTDMPLWSLLQPDDAKREILVNGLGARMLKTMIKTPQAMFGYFENGRLLGMSMAGPPCSFSLPSKLSMLKALFKHRRAMPGPMAMRKMRGPAAFEKPFTVDRQKHDRYWNAWVLPVVTVRPEERGRGIGSLLMEKMAALADSGQTEVFALNYFPDKNPFLLRHGYSIYKTLDEPVRGYVLVRERNGGPTATGRPQLSLGTVSQRRPENCEHCNAKKVKARVTDESSGNAYWLCEDCVGLKTI